MKRKRPIDYVEAQSFSLNAESFAASLLRKHKGNLAMVKKDEMLSTKGVLPKKFRDEVVWAATWMDP